MCRQKMQHLITLIAQISAMPRMAAAAQQESFFFGSDQDELA